MPIRIGPEVNLTNCVLYLDAKNEASYNGNGNVWYDCSGNGNNFTLQGNPSWDGTKISFNTGANAGKNQYAICSNTVCGDFATSSFTIEILFNVETNQVGGTALLANRSTLTEAYGDGNQGFVIGITNQTSFRDNGDIFNSSDTLFNQLTQGQDIPVRGTISYQAYTVERVGTSPPPAGVLIPTNYGVSASFYRDGVLVQRQGGSPNPLTYNLATSSVNQPPTPRGPFNDANGRIDGSMTLQLMYGYGTGSIYSVRMYERVLSQSELLTNYNIYRNYYNF